MYSPVQESVSQSWWAMDMLCDILSVMLCDMLSVVLLSVVQVSDSNLRA